MTRLHYLDYLRAGLVALVLFHHTAITYGAPGSWYYTDPHPAGPAAQGLLTMFVAWNQAYFMGLLFFISGYLSPTSYARKGPGRYLADRLWRFGIPLVAYIFFLQPLLQYVMNAMQHGPAVAAVPYWIHHYLTLQIVDPGPLWFIEALLVFDVLFVGWMRWRGQRPALPAPFPGNGRILAFALVLGLSSFLVRIAMPVGQTFAALQLGYFPGYVALFVLGVDAQRRGWLELIPGRAVRLAKRLVVIALVTLVAGVVLLATQVAAVGAQAASADVAGGLHVAALYYALWEPLVICGMCIWLLDWGRRRLNRPSPGWKAWSSGSYLVYIIQPLVLVPLALAFRFAAWPGLLKFLVVGTLAVVLANVIARLLRQLGPVRSVVG